MGKKSYAGAVVRFSGIVQGVGFRPHVYRSARRFNLKGSVRNTNTGVLIEIDGRPNDIEHFFEDLRLHPPVLAEIHQSSLDYCPPHGYEEFSIAKSSGQPEGFTPLSPDIATCSDCLEDIFDHKNRRYMYPFTNCTNCGPRFTIIMDIPYDRKNTTMSGFEMCPQCAEEYDDPLDRRYHAQPNACPECGPKLTLLSSNGEKISGDPVKETIRLLRQGSIVAVKGLGGFHLAAVPQDDSAVVRLRKRKRRPGKPFALMVRDPGVAQKYCNLGEDARQLLVSMERPIVLCEKRTDAPYFSDEVAPDTNHLGLMLPYTPLHHMLFHNGPEILIMTSANISEEPLVYTNRDALKEVANIADAFLLHDREIQRPCDDSLLFPVHGAAFFLRRSRGFVPRAIDIGAQEGQLFAAGASEKNTFCVLKNGKAYVSHHIGDLENEKSVDAYRAGVRDFLRMFRVNPAVVACDLHPDYVSTRIAEQLAGEWNVPLVRIQHHHAHIASVLAEYQHEERVIGVALDGTGYGADGTVWGGEFIIADRETYERAGHFACVPMPGGDKSILETDRMAISYLKNAYGSLDNVPSLPFLHDQEPARLRLIEELIEAGTGRDSAHLNCPLTSSCGRLFDAVSALLGLCVKPAYDAQGAILLETAAGDFDTLETSYTFLIDRDGVVDFQEMIRQIVRDVREGEASSTISRKFHSTVVFAGVEMCVRIKQETGIETAALAGGVFQNRHVVRFFIEKLREQGFHVLIHRLVPTNDGGISLGQSAIAARNLEKGD
jgi:hydrogenase maturation protein HypF